MEKLDLEDLLEKSKQIEVKNLADMGRAADRLFKHDAISRLKMIQMLHDF